MDLTISNKWDQYLDSFEEGDKDLYYKEEYVKLYETDSEKGVCCIAKQGDNIMLFPYLERTFTYFGKTFHDFETAYGYGGPIFNFKDKEFQKSALEESFDFLKRNDYICGFARFHTLLRTHLAFSPSEVIFDRKTVAMDLTLSEDEIFTKEIHSKNRNVIRKAEKSGLQYIADDKFEYLDEFILLYNGTLDKLSADEFYYFNNQYYRDFIKNIPNSFLGVVLLDGKVISAAIFMYEGIYGHYHLSGSDKGYLSYSPNNYMLYKSALELKKRGVELFHLGGGTTSDENDSLFAFKKKFSPSLYGFYIGKVIFNHEFYSSICEKWEAENPEKAQRYGRFLLRYKY
ncbi:MAG: GNAT family N-acetyltransferase [Clostridiaceae bacterium]|nr:GNAT family N-acetyltransferase [Clostridiaceae bacterium]